MNAPEIKICEKSSENIENVYFPVYALSKSLECSKFGGLGEVRVDTLDHFINVPSPSPQTNKLQNQLLLIRMLGGFLWSPLRG